ncbi:low temperature requirement protein A [Solwaraspora sp. WMMB335]|uniref:low temperature requirement protein A n=1 Tax=Solwaraspora sp. WMMB335 TaxID=3404118 RepID=UPI003B927E5E
MTQGGPRQAALARRLLVARTQAAGGDVSWMELFIDLFFVYAFLSVTTLAANRLGWLGLAEGLLLALLLWQCWTPCAWLGNIVQLDRGAMPLVVFVIAITLLVMGVAIPRVFDPTGVALGPAVVAGGYLAIRCIVLGIMTYLWWPDGPSARRPVRLAWLTVLAGGLALAGAVVVPPYLPPTVDEEYARFALFAIAVVVDFGIVRAVGRGRWRVVSIRHIGERHGLVVLVALGETLIAVGTSQGFGGDQPITGPLLAGAVLSIAVVAVLWWVYFDVAKAVTERAIEQAGKDTRSQAVRDAYSGLHLPMIVGLLLLALELKQAVRAAAGGGGHPWHAPSAVLLFVGAGIYLVGLVGFHRRATGQLGRSPLVGIGLLVVLAPVAAGSPPLGSLGLLAGAVGAMVVADRTVFRRRHRELHQVADPEIAHIDRVTSKELFVDLVFVFAFLQVTVLMARQESAVGILQGMILLALLWWGWSSVSWVTNAVRAEDATLRVAMVVVVAATLVFGIALPQIFEPDPAAIPGLAVIAAAYGVARLAQLLLARQVGRQVAQLRRIVRHAAVGATVSFLLLSASALAELVGIRTAADDAVVTVVLGVVVVIEFFGRYRTGLRPWQIRSARHWADRFALIMLVAFGEVVISTGVPGTDRGVTTLTLAVLGCAAAVLCALWWSYFDADGHLAQHTLAMAHGDERARLARDAYTYLHLPMVAGLMLFAFGLRDMLALHGDRPQAVPHLLGQVALYGGVVGYLTANQIFWWRVWHRLSGFRIGCAATLAVLAPVAASWPTVWSLALLAVVVIGFVTVETLSSGERRAVHRTPVR